MKLLAALLCALPLMPLARRDGPTHRVEGEHVTVTARCDPPVVLPGGWVDVVIAYELESGWHTTSPSSKSGPRTVVDLKLPDGAVLTKHSRSTPGRIVHDATFGDVEQISGNAEIRRRIRMPRTSEQGTREIEGKLTLVACDFERCLPPQTIAFRAPLEVSSKDGVAGPKLDDELVLTTQDVAKFLERGFLVRANPDVESAPPGGEFLLIVDVVLGPGMTAEDVSITAIGNEKILEASRGWTTRRRPVESGEIHQAPSFTIVIPLRVAQDVTESRADLPLAVHYRTRAKGGVLDFVVHIGIDR